MSEVRLSLEGIGVLGGFGIGIEALEKSLAEGRTIPSKAVIESDEGQREISAYLAGTADLEQFFSKRELRRIDHYSKMALLGASLALRDAGGVDPAGGSTGIIIATGYGPHRTTFGFLDSFIRPSDAFASPTHFASSVHNAAAAYTSILLKQTGPSLTVSQFEMSVTSALLTARCWLEEGRVERVLFGALDEYSDVLGYCWERYFEAATGVGRPFDPLAFGSQTALPGEGAGFLVLSKERNRAAHGFITDIDTGFMERETPERRPNGPLILGADGHKDTGGYYEAMAREGKVLCFSPLYGSLPTGQIFDVVIAALLLGRAGRSRGAAEAHAASAECLKIDRKGQWGRVRVARE